MARIEGLTPKAAFFSFFFFLMGFQRALEVIWRL